MRMIRVKINKVETETQLKRLNKTMSCLFEKIKLTNLKLDFLRKLSESSGKQKQKRRNYSGYHRIQRISILWTAIHRKLDNQKNEYIFRITHPFKTES